MKSRPLTMGQLKELAPPKRSKVASRRRFAIAYRHARLVAIALGKSPTDPGTYRIARAMSDRD